MLPIRTENGKPYIGPLEVQLEPVFLGLGIDVGFEGRAPPLEIVIADTVGKLYLEEGINLFGANAYRIFVLGEVKSPEQKVTDGTVPASTKRKVNVDFYKATPISPPGQKKD